MKLYVYSRTLPCTGAGFDALHLKESLRLERLINDKVKKETPEDQLGFWLPRKGTKSTLRGKRLNGF